MKLYMYEVTVSPRARRLYRSLVYSLTSCSIPRSCATLFKLDRQITALVFFLLISITQLVINPPYHLHPLKLSAEGGRPAPPLPRTPPTFPVVSAARSVVDSVAWDCRCSQLAYWCCNASRAEETAVREKLKFL